MFFKNNEAVQTYLSGSVWNGRDFKTVSTMLSITNSTESLHRKVRVQNVVNIYRSVYSLSLSRSLTHKRLFYSLTLSTLRQYHSLIQSDKYVPAFYVDRFSCWHVLTENKLLRWCHIRKLIYVNQQTYDDEKLLSCEGWFRCKLTPSAGFFQHMIIIM